MTKQDETRAKWKAHVDYLRTKNCSSVNPHRLAEVEEAICRCPYPSVSDAIMQINGGWICGEEYDLCLAALLQAGCLEPSGYGSFRINRVKLPQVYVENELARVTEISTRPFVKPEEPVKITSEPPPLHWGLF